MSKVKRFFECLLPVSVCNLECPYCYIIQENRRYMEIPKLPYSAEHIAEALRPERVGGICFISLCGAGETMAQTEIIDIVRCLLAKGHYVNITTNGTLSAKFDRLIEECGELIRHLHISFSMHYTELLRHGWVDLFFDNIIKVRNAGASFLLQLNLCDDYFPYIDEIKRVSYQKVGAYPQIPLTRNEHTYPYSIFTSGTEEEYCSHAAKFDSPLFDFTKKNFNVPRKEFCFAGDWSGTLNMQTGILKKCYSDEGGINIFEDIHTPIQFKAIGCNCQSPYCINSSHFLSLGVIPSLKTPSYAQLRNREKAGWYTSEMEEFLGGKLSDNNSLFSSWLTYTKTTPLTKQIRSWLSRFRLYQILRKIKRKLYSRKEH